MFAKAIRQAPKRAIVDTLSNMVFEAKKSAPDQIASAMTLRARGFISSSLRYEKATSSRLESVWGIKERERFTGLSDQEFGRTTSKRAATLLARGDNLKSRVKPRLRLKPSTKVLKAEDLQRKPTSNGQFIQILKKTNYRGLFLLTRKDGARSGIYQLRGGRKTGKPRLIQAIGNIPQQKRRPWMDPTNQEILRRDVGAKRWASSMKQNMWRMLKRG